MNCAAGVFGPGYRANATIGRALRLIMINVGGTRAGQISMSTMGHPGRYTYCIGEYEEASPWEPLHVERGFAASDSTVTLFSGESPFMINDHLSRVASQLVASLGWSAAGAWNHKSYPLYGHTLFVIGPEHAKTLGEEGWSKDDVRQYLAANHIIYEPLPGAPGNGAGDGGTTAFSLSHESRASAGGAAGAGDAGPHAIGNIVLPPVTRKIDA